MEDLTGGGKITCVVNEFIGLTVGRIVHYVLSDQDAEKINRWRRDYRKTMVDSSDHWVNGTIAHVGNEVSAGEHYPMVVVAVWTDGGCVNGKVFLDGNDDYWALSRSYSEAHEPSTWHWIERA
jgi:hypothetical protein